MSAGDTGLRAESGGRNVPLWVLPALAVLLGLVGAGVVAAGIGDNADEVSIAAGRVDEQLESEPVTLPTQAPVELDVTTPSSPSTTADRRPRSTVDDAAGGGASTGSTAGTTGATTPRSTSTAPTAASSTTDRPEPVADLVNPGSPNASRPEVVAGDRLTLETDAVDGREYRFRVYARPDGGERIVVADSDWGVATFSVPLGPLAEQKLWWTVASRDAGGTESAETAELFFYVKAD